MRRVPASFSVQFRFGPQLPDSDAHTTPQNKLSIMASDNASVSNKRKFNLLLSLYFITVHPLSFRQCPICRLHLYSNPQNGRELSPFLQRKIVRPCFLIIFFRRNPFRERIVYLILLYFISSGLFNNYQTSFPRSAASFFCRLFPAPVFRSARYRSPCQNSTTT